MTTTIVLIGQESYAARIPDAWPSSIAAKPPCALSTRRASSITSTAPPCGPSRSTPIPTAMRCLFARPTRPVSWRRASSCDPDTHQTKSSYVDYARLQRALWTGARRSRLGGLGIRGRARGFRRSVPRHGHRVHRPGRRRHAAAGRQDLLETPGRTGQHPGRPWSGGPVETLADARQHAQQLGYPLFIKATAGGGGHGIRRVNSVDELAAAFECARARPSKRLVMLPFSWRAC